MDNSHSHTEMAYHWNFETQTFIILYNEYKCELQQMTK